MENSCLKCGRNIRHDSSSVEVQYRPASGACDTQGLCNLCSAEISRIFTDWMRRD